MHVRREIRPIKTRGEGGPRGEESRFCRGNGGTAPLFLASTVHGGIISFTHWPLNPMERSPVLIGDEAE
jgi:hypothetical protein